MNRRSFLLLGVATSLVASAHAAPVPDVKSTLIVNVLSVGPEEVRHHDFRRESFKTGERSSGWDENTTMIAKAQVQTVLMTMDPNGWSKLVFADCRSRLIKLRSRDR